MGRLSIYEAPGLEPVTLDEAKLHARIDGTDDDELIEALIKAAREAVEEETRRALVSQTWEVTNDYGFPASFQLPKPPLISVDAITYVDTDGVTQTLATDQYTVDAPSGPSADFGRVVPAYSVSWPTTRSVINAVTVRFTCGYGDPEDVPETIRTAVKVLVSELYANREESVVGTVVAKVSRTVSLLLMPFRAMRW